MSEILPWLTTIWQQLSAYKKQNSIPSGMLLSGPQGIGKFSLARTLAGYLLCSNNNEYPCGECRSCLLYKAGNHPDFFPLAPLEKSHTIKIEQVRDLIKSLHQTSVLECRQIALICLAEQMNKASCNALLKTLEEPPGAVTVILVSNQPTLIPATIRSRCQLFQIPVPKHDQALFWLEQQLGEAEQAKIALSIADGLPLNALKYTKHNQHTFRDMLISYLLSIQNGVSDPLQAAVDCLSSPKEHLQFLLTIVMDMIRLKYCAKEFLNHGDKIVVLSELGTSLTLTKLFEFLQQLLEAEQLLAQGNNVNLQLLMEKIFITWRYINDIS